MDNVTTISVEAETKKIVAEAKQYKGQTYDELLRDTFLNETAETQG